MRRMCGEQALVVRVGAGDHHRQEAAVLVDEDAALHPGLAAVGGVAPDGVPPERALPMLVSSACHAQVTPAAWATSAQTRSSTPLATQRWSVRCTEESLGKLAGSRFH